MTLGARAKLFIATFLLIVAVVISVGFALSSFLKHHLSSQIETELERHAASIQVLLETSSGDFQSIQATDPLADALGQAISMRVTILAGNGTILGDSALSVSEIDLDKQQEHPEVKKALKNGFSKATRYSAVSKGDMLFVSRKFKSPQQTGVVRISKPIAEIDRVVSQINGVMIVAGFVCLIIALVVSSFSSHYFSKTLGVLVDFARKTAEGEKPRPITETAPDEFGGLVGSLNILSEQLEEHVTTLAEERDGFHDVLEGMNEAVLAVDEEYKISLINRAGLMMLGLAGQPIGSTLLDTLDIPSLYDTLSNLREEDESTLEFDLPAGDKTSRILARIRHRRKGGYVIVLLDVTEMRQLESMRRDFVSNVSHELRTPISIIRANAETLLGGAKDDKEASQHFLESVLENAERLSALISDLLDISKIEAGKYELKMEPMTISIALRRAAAALEIKAMEHGFSIEVEPSGDTRVLADARALDQVLYNLTDNAVKYSGQNARVVLRAQMDDAGETIEIEVEDNGPGIAPKHRARLFERFYRVDPGRSRATGGTGLGLAIVKHLVTAMNGTLGMKPATSGGSVFWFTLPAVITRKPVDYLDQS